MNIVACDYERHAAPILAILNDAIVHSTALFDYEPRAPETMVEWFRAKEARRFPVLGAVADDGDAARVRDLRHVPRVARVQVHDRALRLRAQGPPPQGRRARAHDAAHRAAEQQDLSRHGRRHRRGECREHRAARQLGFAHAGIIHHAGFKFGRWLDLAFYELRLRTPAAPVDG